MSVYRHWDDLRKQTGKGIQRRVSSGSPMRVYACVDYQGSVGIRFEGQWSTQEIPSLEFIALTLSARGGSSTCLDVFLKDELLIPLFQVLCDDLIEFSTGVAASINTIIERLVHWKNLLANAESEQMSVKKLRGLVGELLMLKRLGSLIGIEAAVAAWSGPLGTPQDFYYSSSCLEVKAVGPGVRRLQINGVDQLDPANACDLYLCLLILGQVAEEDPKAISLGSILESLKTEPSLSAGTYGDLLGRLQSTGWRADSKLNFVWFEMMASRTFHVVAEFPRLRKHELAPGISFIRYDVELAAIKLFEVECLPGEINSGT